MTTLDMSHASLLVRRPIRADEVAQIRAMEDPVVRNLWITTAYHDLTEGLVESVGPKDVSWPAFATWASKTAGAFIRGDELEATLRALLRQSPVPVEFLAPLRATLHAAGPHVEIDAIVLRLFKDPIQRVADQIARGNRTVFEELGPLFAHMAMLFEGAAPPSPAAIDEFIRSVRSLHDEPTPTAQLKSAFGHYCSAAATADLELRAEHVLVGTGLIGLTEQTRLQPFIKGSLDAPLELPLPALPIRSLVPHLAAAHDGLIAHLRELWRRALTELIMTLPTPGRVFRLGHDVPPFGPRQFPGDLETLAEPDLVKFVEEHDRTGGTATRSGANDWADLGDRMNYLVNLFRSWQQDVRLRQSPFTPEQIAEMQAGRMPTGEL